MLSRAQINQLAPSLDDQRLFDFDHPEVALQAIGEVSLAAARRDSSLYAIIRQPQEDVFAEGELDDAIEALMTPGIRNLAVWMELMYRTGKFREVDFLATAAAAVGAIAWFHLSHDFLGVKPAGVDEERFLASWVDLYLTYLSAPGL